MSRPVGRIYVACELCFRAGSRIEILIPPGGSLNANTHRNGPSILPVGNGSYHQGRDTHQQKQLSRFLILSESCQENMAERAFVLLLRALAENLLCFQRPRKRSHDISSETCKDVARSMKTCERSWISSSMHTVADINPASPNTYYTTIVPRVFFFSAWLPTGTTLIGGRYQAFGAPLAEAWLLRGRLLLSS